MEVRTSQNNARWDSWLQENGGSFCVLQSSIWAHTIESIGRKVEMLEVVDAEQVVAVALIEYRSAGFGKTYAFCPKGPVLSRTWKEKSAKPVIDVLCDYVKTKNCIFFRIEPAQSFNFPLSTFHSVRDINPPATLLLDLTPTPAQLLAAMHQKTRYNIRLAERKGVHIKVEKSLPILWNLLQKTGVRDRFSLHPKKTYAEVLKLDCVEQLVAYLDGVPVATGCFIRFGNVVSYLYGASDHAYREAMAPHMVQWVAIQRAQTGGAKTYDFFGIAPVKEKGKAYNYNEKHRYAGVTRFKIGFGGVVHEDPGTFDIIFSTYTYYVFSFVRGLRSLLHI